MIIKKVIIKTLLILKLAGFYFYKDDFITNQI